jgi:hypothetical protein
MPTSPLSPAAEVKPRRRTLPVAAHGPHVVLLARPLTGEAVCLPVDGFVVDWQLGGAEGELW